MPTNWIIEWPDGSRSEARSAYELLAALGQEQTVAGPLDAEQMKQELSLRAQANPEGTGQYIHPAQPDKPFLRELARVGLFTIIQEGDY
jgi:hypothetical protein